VINRKSLAAAAPDPNFYYYSSGRKIALPLSKEIIAVWFKQGVTAEQQRAIVEFEQHSGLFSERKDILLFKMALLPLSEGVTKENVIQTIHSLNTKSEVQFASPIFHFPDAELILMDEFIVKFVSSVSEAEIRAFNALNDVEIARKPEWTERYTLRVKDPTNMNTLKTANLYYESPITEFAMPNFVRKLKPMSVTPDDTYFDEQWALDNIDAPEGWEISTGSSDIVIAIIDEGVDLGHDDLINKLVDGWDCVEDDDDPTPWGNDAHGTACAGLAAADTNNVIGVAGVSWNCKIMPIRIASGQYWFWTTEEWAANGIEYASDNGADVLSNSWGGGPDSDTIHNAIIEAKNNGRNGNGCVIVFSSGNSGGAVSYPAKYTEVIAVGATDEDDIIWDYSNHGDELDVVAPSGLCNLQGNIWTTDITGAAGYNNRDPLILDYTDKMGGTSAAAPEVAGLAGLILSVNPELTADEVQFIIESTADDVDESGGWDEEYGWGRINNESALLEADEFPTDDTLVGWWKFDEGSGDIAYDSAGNNNGRLGALEGADSRDPAWVEGKINGALDFDVDAEEEDYVLLDPIGALATDNVTISAWIKADDVTGGVVHPIVTQYDQPNYPGYYLYVSGNLPKFYLSGEIAESVDTIDTNEWYHIAGTYDGSDLKIYVNALLSGYKSNNINWLQKSV